jgi:uncharacterized protein (DUF1810 family)
MNNDPYNLKRFLEAQVMNYDDALAELKAGEKRSRCINNARTNISQERDSWRLY